MILGDNQEVHGDQAHVSLSAPGRLSDRGLVRIDEGRRKTIQSGSGIKIG